MSVYITNLIKQVNDLEKLVCEKKNPVKKFNTHEHDPDFSLMMQKTRELNDVKYKKVWI